MGHTRSVVVEKPILCKKTPVRACIVRPSGSVFGGGLLVAITLVCLGEYFGRERRVKLLDVTTVRHPEVS
jgi:hypothetical protein